MYNENHFQQLFKEARSKLKREGYLEAEDLDIDVGLVYK